MAPLPTPQLLGLASRPLPTFEVRPEKKFSISQGLQTCMLRSCLKPKQPRRGQGGERRLRESSPLTSNPGPIQRKLHWPTSKPSMSCPHPPEKTARPSFLQPHGCCQTLPIKFWFLYSSSHNSPCPKHAHAHTVPARQRKTATVFICSIL